MTVRPDGSITSLLATALPADAKHVEVEKDVDRSRGGDYLDTVISRTPLWMTAEQLSDTARYARAGSRDTPGGKSARTVTDQRGVKKAADDISRSVDGIGGESSQLVFGWSRADAADSIGRSLPSRGSRGMVAVVGAHEASSSRLGRPVVAVDIGQVDQRTAGLSVRNTAWPPVGGGYCSSDSRATSGSLTGSPREMPGRTGLLAGAGTLLCTLTAAVDGIAGRPFVGQ
jgi:hypothetical protein